MLNERQSFLVSLAMHLGLVLVLLVAGALVARRIMGPKPIELELMAPVEVGPEEEAAAPEEPELKPEIIKREIEDPTYDPNRSFDIDNIPDVEREEFNPYEPKVEITDAGGSSNASTSYGALIVAACKKNWTPPGRGVLGRPVPTADAEITVARDGRILGCRITRSSGIALLDRSVLEAIRASNPLPAFPRELTGVQRKFTVTFIPEE